MDVKNFVSAYDFTGKTIAITGGGGVLCGEMARALAGCHANVVILDRDVALAEKVLATLKGSKGAHQAAFIDVLDKAAVQQAAEKVIKEYGILPSQAFGRCMVKQKEGVILNVSSMNAFRPLTRIPAYSAAKAAVSNFTQWLAVHLAQEYSTNIRVNAIAPGFFLTEQNRFLLTDKGTGGLTARGHKIIDHTPMARFGTPEDLVGAVLWLLSPASNFVTGIVLPIDGGFSAYSGV